MPLYCPLQFNHRGKGHMQALVRIHFKSEGEPACMERWHSLAAIIALVKAGTPIDPVVLSDALRHTTEEKAA